jgi:hypothetical protein
VIVGEEVLPESLMPINTSVLVPAGDEFKQDVLTVQEMTVRTQNGGPHHLVLHFQRAGVLHMA